MPKPLSIKNTESLPKIFAQTLMFSSDEAKIIARPGGGGGVDHCVGNWVNSKLSPSGSYPLSCLLNGADGRTKLKFAVV